MKIVLIGFMGTGKSSVAPLLAHKLGLEAIEMDDQIVKRAGGMSIADIFASGGETAFRELEAAVGNELLDRDQSVISTGGGVIMNENLMKGLVKDAIVVYLATSFDVSVSRADNSNPARPLLKDPDKARKLYETRQPFYSKYATLRIDTDNLSVDEVVNVIVDRIGQL